ncbi:hypothetical protein [Motilibacter aurantiacus]|uniref:hypothetical protein n=1 Tax=Motilibacter aurantiacus TaxID=2714955 RepID=UPI001409974E|nr:hypothetical protein [Motilibacter aurantiacus]NHC46090.1 hypothetical protein [Motilibacter aurantiacus]
MTNVGEDLLTSHLSELAALARAHHLFDVEPVDTVHAAAPEKDAELSVQLGPGATYADVRRFELAAAALLGVPVVAVSKAAAAVPVARGTASVPQAAARAVARAGD